MFSGIPARVFDTLDLKVYAYPGRGMPAEASSFQFVEGECRRLIEVCGSGGGYILSPGAIPEFPRLENLKAVAATVRKYGFYSSS